MASKNIGLTHVADNEYILKSIHSNAYFESEQWKRFQVELEKDREYLEERHSKWCKDITSLYKFAQVYKDKLVIRVVGVNTWWDGRRSNPVRQEWTEVFRAIEGDYIGIQRNNYETQMYGRRTIVATEEHNRKYLWDTFDEWKTCHVNRFNGYTLNAMYTLEELIELRPILKYSQINIDNNVIEYLGLYTEHPSLEFLKKCKFTYLYSNKSALKKLDKDKTYMKFLFQCYKAGKVNDTHQFYLAYYKRYNMDLSHYETFREAYTQWQFNVSAKTSNTKYYGQRWYKQDTFGKVFSTLDSCIDLMKYLKNKGTDIYRYKDYLSMADKVGHNIEDEYWLFPNDVNKAHDKVMEELKNVQATATALKGDYLKAVSQAMADEFNATVDGYDIFIPTDMETITKQCDTLYQCLIRNNYVTKVLNQEEILVFVWKDGQPIATAEVFYDKKLGQFYGDERGHSRGESCLPSEEVQAAFNKWLELFEPKKAKAERSIKYYKGFHSVDENGIYHTSYGDFSFEIGKTYATPFDDEEIITQGGAGCVSTTRVFHFCESISEISHHYSPTCYCEIEPLGPVVEHNGACLSNRIKIVRAISEEELVVLRKQESLSMSLI